MQSSKQDNTESLARKGRKNALTGIVYFVVNTITALIITPILVGYLGSYYFGIWKAIEKFIGFASIADGQGTQALKWTIAHDETNHDYCKKQRFIASALVVWTLFVPILISLVGLFLYFSPLLINNVNPSDIKQVYAIIAILGVNLVITPLLAIPESVLIGTNRGHIANNIKVIWLLITFVLTYLVVIFKYGLIELSLLILAISVLRGVHYLYISKKLIVWFGYKKPQKEELKSFFKFSSWKLIWAFNARFLLSSEIIFLAILVDPSSVSKYVFTSYIPVTGILLSAIITSAFNPGIGRLVGAQEHHTSQKFIFNLREFVLAFGGFIGAIALLLNKSFVILWAGEELYLGDTTNLLIVLIMIQLVIIRNEAFLIDLSLNIKKKVLLGLFSSALSVLLIVLGYWLTNSIYSIFLGLLLGRTILLFLFPKITNEMIQNRNKNISFGSIFSIACILFIAYFIGERQLFEYWYELILFGLTEAVLCAIVIYVFVLKKENKLIVSSKVFKLFKGKLQ